MTPTTPDPWHLLSGTGHVLCGRDSVHAAIQHNGDVRRTVALIQGVGGAACPTCVRVARGSR
jgi:hypothetical protein